MKNPNKKQLLAYIDARIVYHNEALSKKRFKNDDLKHIEALKELNNLKTFISGE